MWRNTDVVAFVEWLRGDNRQLPSAQPRSGFFGLDLYSLFSSTEEVIRYLERVDPDAAARARARYACFDHADRDSQSYGYAASRGLADSCEHGVVEQLLEMQRRSVEPPTSADDSEEARFHAEQNALLVKDAEEYYRSMFRGGVSSWNIRDQHMARSLDRLVDHLSRRRGQPAKVVVWAHNSHLGDARATAMGRRGEVNVGQLVRERYGDAARLIGFSTYDGTGRRGRRLGRRRPRAAGREARPGSWEHLLHEVGVPQAAAAAARATGPRVAARYGRASSARSA
jgi:erythromycin esterase-like protein